MKKFLLTLTFSLFSIAGLMAQPMPNTNRNNNPEGTLGNSTQMSISTMSIDQNQWLMIMGVIVIAATVFYVANKKKGYNS